MAVDNYAAANELFVSERWRSAVSRAYYAAFTRCIQVLLDHGHTMPPRGNPSHPTLQAMVEHNLSKLSPARRHMLSGMLQKLYKLRVMADYGAYVVIGKVEARVAIGLMVIFRETRG